MTSHPVTGPILICEDDTIVALGLEMLLEEQGFETTPIASSAAEAVTFAEVHRPALALVDIGLAAGSCGRMAGREMAYRLGIPVIYLTGQAEPCEAAEAEAWLVKPFDPSRLLDLVGDVLDRGRAAV